MMHTDGYRGRGTDARLHCPCGRTSAHVPSPAACYATGAGAERPAVPSLSVRMTGAECDGAGCDDMAHAADCALWRADAELLHGADGGTVRAPDVLLVSDGMHVWRRYVRRDDGAVRCTLTPAYDAGADHPGTPFYRRDGATVGYGAPVYCAPCAVRIGIAPRDACRRNPSHGPIAADGGTLCDACRHTFGGADGA